MYVLLRSMYICIYVDTYSMYIGTLWTKLFNASIYHSVHYPYILVAEMFGVICILTIL
jgi:hypothetical protein